MCESQAEAPKGLGRRPLEPLVQDKRFDGTGGGPEGKQEAAKAAFCFPGEPPHERAVYEQRETEVSLRNLLSFDVEVLCETTHMKLTLLGTGTPTPSLKRMCSGYVVETGHVKLKGTAAQLLADPAIRAAYLGL